MKTHPLKKPPMTLDRLKMLADSDTVQPKAWHTFTKEPFQNRDVFVLS